jgi:hypothetical protein
MNTSQLIAAFAGADLDQPTKAARVLSIEFCARWQTRALYSAKKNVGAGLKAIGAVNAGPGTGEPFRPHLRGGIMAREPQGSEAAGFSAELNRQITLEPEARLGGRAVQCL